MCLHRTILLEGLDGTKNWLHAVNITIVIVHLVIIIHLYSAPIHLIHYLPDALYKTIPKSYNFTLRNLKSKKTSKIPKKVESKN